MCCKNREQTDIISSLFNIYINELAKELTILLPRPNPNILRNHVSSLQMI